MIDVQHTYKLSPYADEGFRKSDYLGEEMSQKSLSKLETDTILSSPPTDHVLGLLSAHIAHILRSLCGNETDLLNCLPSLEPSVRHDTIFTNNPDPLFKRIFAFLQLILAYSGGTVSESLYAIYLIEKLAFSDLRPTSKHPGQIVHAQTAGTLIICAYVLSIKTLRDRPLPNAWWMKVFGIQGKVLESSELAFLSRLEFDTHISQENFDRLTIHFLS
ncbi:hypothetical protein BLNAU_20232 [Blattamonas nauphoetae]|uniref:Cyclin N-terminal domain-containing protein n=1 Tax=Blattamonas nauphoetae TaxID=2049346 RepID=A0ABQ9WZE0_9EUKA|nr:hypothetical protein BLNAU_20232 [Blattamonas nauphoetae]